MASLIAHPLVPVNTTEDTLHDGLIEAGFSIESMDTLVEDENGQTIGVTIDGDEFTLHLDAEPNEREQDVKAMYVHIHDDEQELSEEHIEENRGMIKRLVAYFNSLYFTR